MWYLLPTSCASYLISAVSFPLTEMMIRVMFSLALISVVQSLIALFHSVITLCTLEIYNPLVKPNIILQKVAVLFYTCRDTQNCFLFPGKVPSIFWQKGSVRLLRHAQEGPCRPWDTFCIQMGVLFDLLSSLWNTIKAFQFLSLFFWVHSALFAAVTAVSSTTLRASCAPLTS